MMSGRSGVRIMPPHWDSRPTDRTTTRSAGSHRARRRPHPHSGMGHQAAHGPVRGMTSCGVREACRAADGTDRPAANRAPATANSRPAGPLARKTEKATQRPGGSARVSPGAVSNAAPERPRRKSSSPPTAGWHLVRTRLAAATRPGHRITAVRLGDDHGTPLGGRSWSAREARRRFYLPEAGAPVERHVSKARRMTGSTAANGTRSGSTRPPQRRMPSTDRPRRHRPWGRHRRCMGRIRHPDTRRLPELGRRVVRQAAEAYARAARVPTRVSRPTPAGNSLPGPPGCVSAAAFVSPDPKLAQGFALIRPPRRAAEGGRRAGARLQQRVAQADAAAGASRHLITGAVHGTTFPKRRNGMGQGRDGGKGGRGEIPSARRARGQRHRGLAGATEPARPATKRVSGHQSPTAAGPVQTPRSAARQENEGNGEAIMSEPAGSLHRSRDRRRQPGSRKRVAKLARILGAVAEVTVRRRYQGRPEAAGTRAARQMIDEQQETRRTPAGTGAWAPAHDPMWLAQADLRRTARSVERARPATRTQSPLARLGPGTNARKRLRT